MSDEKEEVKEEEIVSDSKEEQRIWEENFKMMQEAKGKSEDDFEKNLVLITTGSLALSIAFIEKIAPLDKAVSVGWLITGWWILTVSLLVNLISHLVSSQFTHNQIERYTLSGLAEEINKIVRHDNLIIRWINYITLALMIVGIGCIIVYCSENVVNMSKKTPDRWQRSAGVPSPDKSKLNPNQGRTSSPLRPATQPKPTPKPDTTPKKKE